MKQHQSISVNEAVMYSAEYVARDLNIPEVYKNLLDSDTIEALEELRKNTHDGSDSTTDIIGQSFVS